MKNRYWSDRATAMLIIFSLLVTASLWAQTSRGTVAGTITDPSGAVIRGAQVSLKSLATGIVRQANTNNEGAFRFDAVDLGAYEITATMQGFAAYKLQNVDVPANKTTTVEIGMKLASTAEEVVNVEGSLAGLELQRTEERRAVTISQLELKDVPLVGQNSLNLITTVPGAVQTELGGSLDSGIGSINGARARSNNFLVDGMDNNDISVAGPVATLTNNDAIQEVSIQTSNFSAEYGRAGGAVVNQITKAGTNSLHGTGAWVYRSEVFNATTLPQRAGAGPGASLHEIKPPFKENLPAFTIGGPVVIPHLYDGRNKTFFFAAGQWDRFSAGADQAQFSNVPTAQGAAVLQGLAAKCPNVALYLNSLQGLTAPTASGAIDISLPATVFNSTGSCNGAPRTGLTVPMGPVTRTFPSVQLTNNNQIRIDHNPSDRQFMSFRWYWIDFNGGVTAGTAGLSPTFDASQTNRQLSGAFTDTYVISSQTTNEFRFSYGRAHLDVPIQPGIGATLPRFVVSGISSFGTSSTFPQGRVSNNYQYQDTIGMVRGKHSIRTGVEFLRQLAKQSAPINSRSIMTYNPSTGVEAFANFIDDFSGDQGNIAKQFGSPIYRPNLFRWSLFVQDSWQLAPTFTLNAGVRYENFGQPANIFPFPAYSGDDPAKFTVPSKVHSPNKNFGPSLGFAWSPQSGPLAWHGGTGKTVVRGGYQLTYDTFFNNLLSNMAAGAPNNPANLPIIGAQSASAPRGLAGLNQTLLPTVTVGPLNPLAGSSNQFDPNITNPRYNHFSLGVQREVAGGTVIDLSYVGGLGRHLFNNFSTNPFLPNATKTSTGSRLNPAFGPRTIRASEATSNYHAMQLEVRNHLIPTLVGGFEFRSAYTWSRNMDETSEVFVTNNQNSSNPAVNPFIFPNGLRADYGPSDNDRRHVWQTTAVWQVRGPKTGILGQAFGGWTLATIIPVSSGQPYTVINGTDRDLDGSLAGDRPEVGNWNAPFNSRAKISTTCSTGLINPDTGACVTTNDVRWIQVAAYNPNSPRTGRRNSLYTDGSVTMHLNILKHFKITERVGLEYRAEIFNLLNNQNFNFAPFLSGGASTVIVRDAAKGNFLNFSNGDGSETNATLTQRNMRMGLKLSF